MEEEKIIDDAYLTNDIDFDIFDNPINATRIHICFKHFLDANKLYSIFEPYLKGGSLTTNIIKGYTAGFVDIPNDIKISDMVIKNGFMGWGCELILRFASKMEDNNL